MTQPIPRFATGGAVLAVLVLAGCGGGSSGAAAPATGPGATPVTTVVPATTAPDCERATTVANAVHDSHITKIQVIGGCSQISIETSLTRADVATATKICNAAVKVAYVGNVSSVTVTGADKHELAAGEKGMGECIGEP